jgi:hypothetical protein
LEGYRSKELREYYLKPKRTHGYFYHDKDLNECCGCFPLHWFRDFKELEDITEKEDCEIDNFKEEVIHLVEEVINGYEQLSLFLKN